MQEGNHLTFWSTPPKDLGGSENNPFGLLTNHLSL